MGEEEKIDFLKKREFMANRLFLRFLKKLKPVFEQVPFLLYISFKKQLVTRLFLLILAFHQLIQLLLLDLL